MRYLTHHDIVLAHWAAVSLGHNEFADPSKALGLVTSTRVGNCSIGCLRLFLKYAQFPVFDSSACIALNVILKQ